MCKEQRYEEDAMETVRDRLWIWGHEAGSHNTGWGLEKTSRMTPLEGAVYLGIPNLILIRYEEKPAMPFDQYALALKPLRQVYWSAVGGGGATSEEERRHVLDLARSFPNIVGVFMDDFFHAPAHQGDPGTLSLDILRGLKAQMRLPDRSLKLGVTLYAHQLDMPLAEYLALCDEVSLWTWNAPDLKDLDANFSRLEALAPKSGKLVGLYMWDYGLRKPMPLAMMQKQCEAALRWLNEGRIDGMIFLASCICDLGLEAVEWSREWIARVGDHPIPTRA
jgi:hypothetical protein